MRSDARRNREAILASARAAFLRDEEPRFDEFANRAGVGVGTLYRHFPTREALATALYQDEVTSLCERARATIRPDAEALKTFLLGFVDYVEAHVALARVLAGVVDPDEQAKGGGEVERTVAALMARSIAAGVIRDDVAPGAVMLVLHGIGSSIDRPRWSQEARDVVEVLIDGLKPK